MVMINAENGFSLEETKLMQINALKAVRDYKETEPIRYGDHLFDFDTVSYDRITAAIIALGETGVINWTTADNDVVPLNADGLRGIIAAAAVRSNQLHTTYRILKEEIMAASDKYTVLSTEWPED